MNSTSMAPHTAQVREMFARIARRYDLVNRLMTLGRDGTWRCEAVDRLALSGDELVLDVGAGTGDLAQECARRWTTLRVVACDLTPQMIEVGRRRTLDKRIDWVVADAQHLPFAPATFDAAISGFLLRNVDDLSMTLAEQTRVLQPGGHFASLDTTPPHRNALRPFILFHFRHVIPLLGRFVARDESAYRYLPSSTETFVTAEQLASLLHDAGLEQVAFQRRMLGTIAIHSALKPDPDREP